MFRHNQPMKIWRLTPVHRNHPAWRQSKAATPVVIRAPSASIAQFQAACELTRANVPTLAASPWWRADLLRIEQLQDLRLSRFGPTQILSLDPQPETRQFR